MLVIQNRRGEEKWKRKNESGGHRGENCRFVNKVKDKME